MTTVGGFLRQGIRNDIYDSTFLNIEEDDWSTVLMHKQERFAATHLFRSRTSEFMTNEVFEATGLSLTEFLKLPTYLVEHILSSLRQLKAGTRSKGKQMERELDAQETKFQNVKKR